MESIHLNYLQSTLLELSTLRKHSHPLTALFKDLIKKGAISSLVVELRESGPGLKAGKNFHLLLDLIEQSEKPQPSIVVIASKIISLLKTKNPEDIAAKKFEDALITTIKFTSKRIIAERLFPKAKL
jgi:hypothetical protein